MSHGAHQKNQADHFMMFHSSNRDKPDDSTVDSKTSQSSSSSGLSGSTDTDTIASLPTVFTEEHVHVGNMSLYVGSTVTSFFANRIVRMGLSIAIAIGLHFLILAATNVDGSYKELVAVCQKGHSNDECRSKRDAFTSRIIVRDVLLVAMWILMLGIAMKSMGFSIKAVLTMGVTTSAVLAFAAQSLINDVISGITMFSEDQFNIGDDLILNLKGVRKPMGGVVTNLNLRTTEITRTSDNVPIIIPNGHIISVANMSKNPSYISVDVPIPENISFDRAVSIVQAGLNAAIQAIEKKTYAMSTVSYKSIVDTANSTPSVSTVTATDEVGISNNLDDMRADVFIRRPRVVDTPVGEIEMASGVQSNQLSLEVTADVIPGYHRTVEKWILGVVKSVLNHELKMKK